MKKRKGFAIVQALVFCLVFIILGTVIAYITQLGFFSVSAETNYQIAERNAHKGLLSAISEIYNSTPLSNGSKSYFFTRGEAQVKFISDENNNNYFIWSKGTYKSANVVRIAVVHLSSLPWAPFIARNLNSYTSGEIISCNATFKTPALITGNNATLNSTFTVGNCSSTANVRAFVDQPYQIIPKLLNSPAYLTNIVFKNANNRNDIFNILSQKYGVSFNNGTPTGIIGKKVWQPTDIKNCVIYNNSTITCTYTNGTNVNVSYNSTTGNFTIGSKEYDAIDIGNGNLTVKSFNNTGVVAKIAAENIDFTGAGEVSNIILVAREKISIYNSMGGLYTTIKDSYLFSKNYEIHDCHLVYEGGILYSSGQGNLWLRADSSIGTPDNPTLIIADNQLNIDGRCHTSINGLVYITEGNPNFGLSMDTKGKFELNGAIISNSVANFLSMGCCCCGGSIVFQPQILKILSNKLGFIKPPMSSSKNLSLSLITTEMKVD